jgi:hypothetical protein
MREPLHATHIELPRSLASDLLKTDSTSSFSFIHSVIVDEALIGFQGLRESALKMSTQHSPGKIKKNFKRSQAS